jgi:tRNA-dihydrouridine synthase
MEGVTEPCFRGLVLERNPSSDLGGVFTEFLPVVGVAPKPWRVRRHLGEGRFEAPVGLQLMGSDPELLARTVEVAEQAGAPLVDLNFGCPSAGALRTCAGSALLRDPGGIERIVGAASKAARRVPVTAKIRAGYDDDSRLEDLARAAEQGGAAMLTVHCRTRAEGYQDCADWRRIARAVRVVKIPICGNGGVRAHADFARLRAETGCEYAMAGRAALGNPWIFSGRDATKIEAARFLQSYASALVATGKFTAEGAAARVKQLLHFWAAGDLLGSDRAEWLRLRDPLSLLARIGAIANGEGARAVVSSSGAVGVA